MTRLETQVLQVFLMVIIVLHNTSNNLLGAWPLSEFYFQDHYLFLFANHFSNITWKIIPLIIISLGYTAVASFLILTGYGLYKRYEHEPLIFIPYFKRRLTYLFIPWLITSLWIELVLLHSPSLLHWVLMFSTLQLWIPHHQPLLLGPWWFIAMIFELYLIFPVILSSYKKYGFKLILFLILTQYLIQVFINPWTNSWGLNLNLTPISALLPISIGLCLAHKNYDFKNQKFSWLVLLILGILFFIAQINFYTWPFANTLFGLVLLGLGLKLLKFKKIKHSRFMGHLCHLIVPVFLVHGYLYVFFMPWLESSQITFLDYLIILISMLGLTYLCALLVNKISTEFKKNLKNLKI